MSKITEIQELSHRGLRADREVDKDYFFERINELASEIAADFEKLENKFEALNKPPCSPCGGEGLSLVRCACGQICPGDAFFCAGCSARLGLP